MKSLLFSKTTKKAKAPDPSPWEDQAIVLDRDDVSDFNEENILPVSSEERAKIRKWLQPTAYNDEGCEFKKHLSSHLKNTGSWLLEAPTYQKWHSSKDDGILWIKGIPGSGKSVVAATLIEHLRKERVPVLYFFFRQIIDANHVPQAAVRDFIDQILEYSPPLQARLMQYLNESRSLESLPATDFWDLIKMSMLYLPRAYCVVDALDEIDHGQDMLDFLEGLSKLGTWRPSQIKIVMTSRPVPSVEIPLRQCPALILRLEEDVVDRDIAIFVQYMIERSPVHEQYHEAIRKAVPGNANGLFLYAKLAMDAFLEPGADPKQVLSSLPTDLNVMYDDLLREHTRRTGISPDMQLLIMQSVTHASRPLRLLELADMINVTQYSDSTQDLKCAKELVRAACGPLLEILPDETISVIHHSLTEFLKGSTRKASEYEYPVLGTGSTHHRLAMACLTYLQSGCLDTIPISIRSRNGRIGQPLEPLQLTFNKRTSQYRELPAFTGYAATNWHVHVRKSMLAGSDQSQIHATLDEFVASENFKKWAQTAGIGCDRATPLFVAVALGLTQYCERLLDLESTCVNKGDMYEPPLYHAAKNGFDDIVALLVSQGADLHECDEDGYSALHIAAVHKHPKIVRILLQAGADPFAKPGTTTRFYDWGLEPSGTPVSKACSHGHVDTVAELMPYLKTEATVTDALFVAVNYKKAAVVALLLTHPLVDVNRECGLQTLLYVSCAKRDTPSIKMLLEAGAEPNTIVNRHSSTRKTRHALEGSGYTAIHALASAGSLRTGRYSGGSASDGSPEETLEAFALMLKFGANVHQVDPLGQNALFHACDGVTARVLLDAGVRHDLVNKHGENLLHCHDNLEILRHLLETTKNNTSLRLRYEGRTPLLQSLKVGYVQKALLLLEFGANCTGHDEDGNGAFHLAVGISFRDRNKGLQDPLFAALRIAGADVNMRNKAGCTPLHTLDFRNFNDELFKVLLEAGLDTEAKNERGETAIFVALRKLQDWDLPKVCDKMVAVGCDLHATDNEGRNLLHVVQSISPKIMQYLVEKGLDPKQTDDDGNTLWHVMAKSRSHPDVILKVREHGLDPEQANHSGRTPLHIFSSLRPRALEEHGFKNCWPIQIASTTSFDELLRHISQVDPIDAEGVTPLHLASTFSEYLTKRLLKAGADPFKCTEEGLTVFHLAARSRQPNILGVLFDFCAKTERFNGVIPVLNVEDKLGRTVMFYACASGCVKSVKMLIEAGTKVDTEHYEGSAWQGCVAFEDENNNWKYGRYRGGNGDYDWSAPSAGGVTIDDKTRPNMREAYCDMSGIKYRLNEIVEYLSCYKTSARNVFVAALEDATSRELDYTVECLADWKDKIDCAIPSDLVFKVDACLQRRQGSNSSSSKSYACLKDRKFNLATDWLIQCTDSYQIYVPQLVHDGFVSILEKVLTPEAAQKFDDVDWLKEQEKAQSGSKYLYPLLITACQRDIPNMDMVRFLVERMGVDVNARKRTEDQSYGNAGKHIYHESALHYLVRGMNWWQTRQALPYLLSKGAILDPKDRHDDTPLRATLDNVGTILCDRYPIEALVRAGADVNAVNTLYGRRGTSCLARVADDAEMTKYLLEHGAIAEHFDIRHAISKGRCDTLDLLLSYGGDPNGRDTQGPQFDERSSTGGVRGSSAIRKAEAKFPLHHLATMGTEVHTEVREDMASILLRHGANINARYEETPLMHCMLKKDCIARTLLSHPALDIEIADKEGRTLLLAAGEQQAGTRNSSASSDMDTSLVRLLLQRGANVRARDNNGKNLLHYMLSDSRWLQGGRYFVRAPPRNDDFAYVTSLHPDLVHEQDDDGNTPLLYAAKRHMTFVADLLDAGADAQIKNKNGDTALHYIMQGEWLVNENEEVVGLRREMLERLLALGADIHARNHRAETPIFHFFHCEDAQQASVAPDDSIPKDRRAAWNRGKIFLEAPLHDLFERVGVKWTDVDIDNQSLLHVVAGMEKHRDGGLPQHRFKFLLNKGLDVSLEDKWKRTPLDVAAGRQHAEIMALYKREGIEGKPRSEGCP